MNCEKDYIITELQYLKFQGPVPVMAVQCLPTAAAVAAAAATAKIQALDAVASNLGLSTSEILGNKICI